MIIYIIILIQLFIFFQYIFYDGIVFLLVELHPYLLFSTLLTFCSSVTFYFMAIPTIIDEIY